MTKSSLEKYLNRSLGAQDEFAEFKEFLRDQTRLLDRFCNRSNDISEQEEQSLRKAVQDSVNHKESMIKIKQDSKRVFERDFF